MDFADDVGGRPVDSTDALRRFWLRAEAMAGLEPNLKPKDASFNSRVLRNRQQEGNIHGFKRKHTPLPAVASNGAVVDLRVNFVSIYCNSEESGFNAPFRFMVLVWGARS